MLRNADGALQKVLFFLYVFNSFHLTIWKILILAYTCDKNDLEHRKRHTSGMNSASPVLPLKVHQNPMFLRHC